MVQRGFVGLRDSHLASQGEEVQYKHLLRTLSSWEGRKGPSLQDQRGSVGAQRQDTAV